MGARSKQVLAILKPYRGRLIVSLLLTVTLTILGMAPPLLIRRLINDVAGRGQWDLFAFVIAGLFVLPVLTQVVNIFNGLLLNRVGTGIIGATRKRLFAHLMTLSLKFYDEVAVGNIKERLFGDVATVSTAATGGLIAVLSDAVSVIFAMIVMIRLSIPLSVLTVVLIPLFLLNYRFFSKRIRNNASILRSRMDHISTTLQERLSAHELIQSYGQEKQESAHFSSQAKQVMEASIQGSTYSIAFNQIAAYINKLGNTLIYCVGCYLFIRGSIAYGDVVAFCSYATLLLGPVIRLASVANQFVSIGVSVERINQILDRQPVIRESEAPVPVKGITGAVAVHGLTYAYDDGEPVLKNLTFEIPAGSDIAIIGVPGAGRSTLARLLRRFYEPDAGSIEVDGKDIRKYFLQEYRSKVALVLPESTIFEGSIRYNITYGNPDATNEQVDNAARAAGLADFVNELSAGYDTPLGAGGLTLSAGNRQRVGLARALVSDPLVLITDEATAVLDPISAEEVTAAIGKIMADRTNIMIIHRALLAKSADRVFVLDNGSLAETGTHEELIVKPHGVYRALFGYQYGTDLLPRIDDEDGNPK